MLRRHLVCVLFTALLFGGFAMSADAGSKRVERRLDGVLVRPSQANPRVFAVMIDNHTAARPQAGLDKASVVYEALAEGGIPRFMALFARTDLSLVGPIRSARPYFIRSAAEYPAAVFHVGGSPDAQELLKKLKLRNVEGQKGSTAKYFFRKGYGVHATYTNGKLIAAAMKNKKGKAAVLHYRPWKYTVDPPMKKRPKRRQQVHVDLGAGRPYTVGYAYSRRRNAYLRSTGGVLRRDAVSKQPLAAKNVVLLFVPKERVLDRAGRIELKTVGRGKAILLQSGKARTVRWQKKSDRGRLLFTDSRGNEIRFLRGSTWITIVPKGKTYRIY
ncbi:MAG: DUF3048 domain-containing protein [Candidatus Kerfeldbacteria bacterium]|nr:DUF3048 domain-containing protein [Candidatus Kerfeldbacteria bacterium]